MGKGNEEKPGLLAGTGPCDRTPIRTKNMDFRPDSWEPVQTENGQNEKIARSTVADKQSLLIWSTNFLESGYDLGCF